MNNALIINLAFNIQRCTKNFRKLEKLQENFLDVIFSILLTILIDREGKIKSSGLKLILLIHTQKSFILLTIADGKNKICRQFINLFPQLLLFTSYLKKNTVYNGTRYAMLIILCVTRGKVLPQFEVWKYTKFANFTGLYIFHILRHFVTNFTKFRILFPAVLMRFPNSKVRLIGEYGPLIRCIQNKLYTVQQLHKQPHSSLRFLSNLFFPEPIMLHYLYGKVRDLERKEFSFQPFDSEQPGPAESETL